MPSSKVVAAQLKDKAGTRSHPYLTKCEEKGMQVL